MLEQLTNLKKLYMSKIMKCDNKLTVHVAISYAGFLNEWGLNSDNYPLYLIVLNIQNKWVIDALVEGNELKNFLDPVIPNYYIVENIFKIFKDNKRKGIYRKVLIILLGLLEKVYRLPKEGYALYDLDISDVNGMAKYLDEEKGDDDEVNQLILDILENLTDLGRGKKEGEMYETAKQAGKIRTDFFDEDRSLINSLTEVLLEEAEVKAEDISPDYIYK